MNVDVRAIDLEVEIDKANALIIQNHERATIINTLRQVAPKLAEYVQLAKEYECNNIADAERAVVLKNDIADNIKVVESALKLSKSEAQKRHRAWCDLEGLFIEPFREARAVIHRKASEWQVEENRKAEAERRRLQAEVDARAAAERQRLEKKAEQLKTPEKREAVREEAAAVVAPVINVAPQKATGLRMAMVWKVKAINADAFFAALADDKSLRGFVTIEPTKLERAKAANNALEVPGVEFHKTPR